MPSPLAMLYLIASMAMTGANVPLAKALLVDLPAESLLLLRFALASVVLAAVVRMEPGPPLSGLGVRQWGAVTVLGLVGSVLFTWFVLAGVSRTSGASAGIITATLPAVIALAGLALGHRLGWGQVAMIALAVAGVGIVHGEAPREAGAGSATQAALGNLLIGLAVVCEATFAIVARGISTRIRPLRLSLAVALVSLAICLPFGGPALLDLPYSAISAGVWVMFLCYALAASVLGTALWYLGVAHVEPWAAGLATAAVPVAAMAVSAVVLGERISPVQIAGAGLVILAIVIGTVSGRRR
jgi:drug/metabolite transporter (DMT)-like permease